MENLAPGLLERLQNPGDRAAWERLVDLYTPLLYFWGCRSGLHGPEAATLVQQVFDRLAQRLNEVSPQMPGGFRPWLRSLAQKERQSLLGQRKVPVATTGGGGDASPIPAGAQAMWEEEYLPFLLGCALELLQGELPEQTWKVLQALTIQGRPPYEVAREVGITLPEVILTEAQALRRIRQELRGLLD